MNADDSFDDLHRAMAGFLICLGSTLPKELAEKFATRMVALAGEMEHGGKTSVATLTKGFAEALLQTHTHSQH